ncbi:peptidoglycan glycosyltransferase [Opitutaceae bacterium TAV5]|nr:peptidoglycan glycosyltransferase [Opitutaceae bacterium TAV5]
MTSRGFASNYRIALVAGVVVAAFTGIGWRLADLHVFNREHYASQLDRARRKIETQPARRGDILARSSLDVRGNVLATSRTLIHLGVDPQMVREEDRPARAELARLLGLPLSEINRIMDTRTRPAPGSAASVTSAATARRIPEPTAEETDSDDIAPDTGARLIRWAKLSDTVEESAYTEILKLGIRGVYGNRTYIRAYPQRSLAAHLIGYINREGIPSGGVEAWADFYLRGQDGWRESEKDGLRRELAQFRTREVPPCDGYNVVLTIDTVIQHMVEQEMENLVATFRPEKATIIVSEPGTGYLLALANYPTFDLNDYARAPLEVQRNVAATDLVEPGSTFKIVAASAALNEGLVSPDTRFNCAADTVLYRGKPRRLMRDDHPFPQPLSVTEIIAHSSNRGAALLGMTVGDQKFYDYARAFGFGEKSGFPLGYEEGGIFAPPARWSDIDMTRIPAGYSIAATPLQIHYAMAAIANGGNLMVPGIIREVQDFSVDTKRGNEIANYTFAPKVRRTVITPRTAAIMRDLLQRVASDEGTARAAVIPDFEVAGKTGTAQKLINGRYSTRNHVGSFVGFFPASRPRVVISVIVDDGHPANGRPGYGAVVAIPSFKRIGEQLIQYLDIKPVRSTAAGGLLARQENSYR